MSTEIDLLSELLVVRSKYCDNYMACELCPACRGSKEECTFKTIAKKSLDIITYAGE